MVVVGGRGEMIEGCEGVIDHLSLDFEVVGECVWEGWVGERRED